MSLISEALRKARQEAAERDVRERGATVAPRVGEQKDRPRFGAGIVLGAVIACGAGLVGGGAVWWALTGRQEPSTEQPQVAASDVDEQHNEETPAGQASAAVADPVSDIAGSGEEIVSVEKPAGADGTAGEPVENDAVHPVVVDADSQPATVEAAGGSGEAAESDADASSASATPPQADIPDGSRVFAIEADLGYASLSLGYIVFRKENSFAEINGEDVRVGSVIEGFRVEEIGRDQVSLRDDRGPLILRAR